MKAAPKAVARAAPQRLEDDWHPSEYRILSTLQNRPRGDWPMHGSAWLVRRVSTDAIENVSLTALFAEPSCFVAWHLGSLPLLPPARACIYLASSVSS